MDAKLVERLQLCEKKTPILCANRPMSLYKANRAKKIPARPCTFTTCYLNFGLIFASCTSLNFFFFKCGHMVVSQNKGAPIWTPKYSNPYYMDPPPPKKKKKSSNFGKPTYQGSCSDEPAGDRIPRSQRAPQLHDAAASSWAHPGSPEDPSIQTIPSLGCRVT